MKAYMESPLLLEQQEAQLFSVIRQCLLSKESYSSVTIKSFKLIHLFLTTPICKDSNTITKIFQMLFESMQTPSADPGECQKLTSDVDF